MKDQQPRSFWTSTNGLAALALIGAVLYFLLTEHLAHTLSFLPFAILLLCPLMHVFMHRGHGGHGGHADHGDHDTAATNKRKEDDHAR